MKFKYMALIFPAILFLMIPISNAEEYFEGEMVGINCIMGKVDCNSDMYKYAHVSFEPDFVLKIDDKKHYMLDGIPRSMKLRMAGQKAYINGSFIKNGTTISVSRMEMDVGAKRVVCWDPKIKKELTQNKELKNDWIKSLEEEFNLYGH